MTGQLLHLQSFEWIRVMRRLIVPPPVKLTGLLLASYADPDGTRIRPGFDRLARVHGCSYRTIQRHMEWLESHGLIEMVHGGNRHRGETKTFRLSVPEMVLQELPMLDPSEMQPTHVHRTPVSGEPDPGPPCSPDTDPEFTGQSGTVHRTPVSTYQLTTPTTQHQRTRVAKVTGTSANPRPNADSPGERNAADQQFRHWRDRRKAQ